jgi:hypothetical protein
MEEATGFHCQGVGGRHDTSAWMNAEFRVGRLINKAVDDLATRPFVLIFSHDLKKLLVGLSKSRNICSKRVFDKNWLIISDVSYGYVDLRFFRASVVTSAIGGSDFKRVAPSSFTIKIPVIFNNNTLRDRKIEVLCFLMVLE